MIRNYPGQKMRWHVFNWQGRVSGEAANVTAEVEIDGSGTLVPLASNGSVREIGNTGIYESDLEQSETDGYELNFVPAIATPGLEILGSPYNVIYTVNSPSSGPAAPPTIDGNCIPTRFDFELVQQDSYLASIGRAWHWELIIPGANLTNATGAFRGTHHGGDEILGTVTLDVNPQDLTRATLSLEFTGGVGGQTDVADLQYRHDLEITLAGGEKVTVICGVVTVKESQTP